MYRRIETERTMASSDVDSSAKPKYLQIADDLAAQIRSGVLAAVRRAE